MWLKVVKIHSMVVDGYEVQWYIACVGYVISAIISLVVGLMAGLYIKGSHEWAARSLERQLTLSICPVPISGSPKYYTIYITAGKGNWYCRLLRRLRISVRLVVSGNVKWMSSDSKIGFPSDIYPIGAGRRVQKEAHTFSITPKGSIELAVAKEEHFNISPLGRFDWSILNKDKYDLNIDLFNLDHNPLPRLKIEAYISKDGVKLV